MNVEIVTIGDELLLGFTVDLNAAHIARELAAAGIRIVRRATVGDRADDIASAVQDALDRTGAVITTGGLGPTSDDLTKASIATIFHRAMRLDDAILDGLERRWESFGWPGKLPMSNRAQAMVPDGATILANRHGSAPGVWLEDGNGRWVAMLPGVPREMRGMLADELLPRLGPLAGDTPTVIASLTLRTTGLAESAIADRIDAIEFGTEKLSLAYLPGWEGVDLRLTSQDRSASEATRALAISGESLRTVLGGYVYGEDTTDLAEVVLQLLRQRHWHVAVAESCTGGLLGARITAIPGSSEVMLGGVIAYADEIKQTHLGVRAETLRSYGAVSEEVAREMAIGVRDRFDAEVGLSVTGIAGPGGGTATKPVGSVCVAVDVRGAVSAARVLTTGDRDEIRRRSAQLALNLLRRRLQESTLNSAQVQDTVLA